MSEGNKGGPTRPVTPVPGMPAPADVFKGQGPQAAGKGVIGKGTLEFDDDDTAASIPGPARMDQLKLDLARALAERDEARRLLAEEKARADRLEAELRELKK